jgi:hypothetical protein
MQKLLALKLTNCVKSHISFECKIVKFELETGKLYLTIAMKYFVFLMFLSFFFSCAERNQTSDESDKIDQLENVESKNEAEKTEIPEAQAESLGLIGEWTIPSTYGGGELRIEHHLGKYYKNEELSDGTVNILEMTLSEQEGLKVFRVKDGSSDETWVITENGSLEARSKDGLIYSTDPI